MESIARRNWLTAVGAVPMLTGLSVLAARWQSLWGESNRSPRQRFRAEPARELLQQRHLPNVPLVTQDGKAVRFYQDLVKDKKVVLTFINTRIQPDSAKVSQNLATLQKFFGRRIGDDIFMYSITSNPQHDTPDVLNAWASRYGAGPGWQFLTGKRADIEKLRSGLGFSPIFAEDKGNPRYPIDRVLVGVEQEMRWSHCQSLAKPRVIAHTMLLDFGPDPTDPKAPPVWNCRRLLAEIN